MATLVPKTEAPNRRVVLDLDIQALPPFDGYHTGSKRLDIECYLKQVLESVTHTVEVAFLPAPNRLSAFFNCTSKELLAAIEELSGQGYAAQIESMDTPIALYDALQQA